MSLLDTTQQALESAMSGSMMRNTLLTNNLANVDTPGYQPEDVNFQSTLQSAIQSGSPINQVSYQPYTMQQAVGPDGNGVTAERTRMDVTSENLANANTTQGAGGQPYQRQEVVLHQVGGGSGFNAALS